MTCAVAALATSATAEDQGDLGEGIDLLSQGTQLLFQGLLNEIEPALRDMEPALRELVPMMEELRGMLPDLDQYHRPEVLPNGDIIIRRKTPLPEAGEGQEIEI